MGRTASRRPPPPPAPKNKRQEISDLSRICAVLIAIAFIGCAARPKPLVEQSPDQLLDARTDPPPGWKIERADQTDRFTQRVWVSPTGLASYGVIRFSLPLPVGNDIALWGFLNELKRNEGDATLISKKREPGRLRFVAQGGRYHMDGTIVTRSLHGWVAYAGTLTGREVALDELEQAVKARDNTAFGLTDSSVSDR